MKKGVRFHEKKRRYSFDKKESSINNRLNIQRILSVRKMDKIEKNNKDINREIDDYFFSPDKYFQKNSPVTIGKKIYLLDMNDPRLRRGKKLKTEKKMATNLFNNIANYNNNAQAFKLNNNILNSSNTSNFKTKENHYFLNMSSKFEIIDNNRLKMIFDSYKIKDKKDNSSNDKSQISSVSDSFRKSLNREKRVKIQKKYINPSSSMENVPRDIKNTLSLQNKKLNLQKLSERKNILMSRYLSKKLNKPQNNLLINRIDSFRFKKEVINEMEYNKPIDEQYGKFKWNISLRRPDHFQGVRDSYINLKGDRYIPFWSIVIEKCPKQKELCIKPGHILNENEINEFKKNNKINYGNKNQYIKTVENLEDLSIEGKNLYDIEYKREIIDSKKKKILHKVFVENGKAISTIDINNLYGYDTFYKDYNGCSTEKNIRMNKNYYRYKL